MVKYITSGTYYSFLNSCILYIIILHLQQSLLKHMPLLRTVDEMLSVQLRSYTAACYCEHYAAKILSINPYPTYVENMVSS
jgi:hypothetical protein